MPIIRYVDAPGNDGNASMPEQVKRPNPWRKMVEKYCRAGQATDDYGACAFHARYLRLQNTLIRNV